MSIEKAAHKAAKVMKRSKQNAGAYEDLALLKMTAFQHENGEVTIKAITPVSTVELTAPNEDVGLQVFSQLGKRLLASIESELVELKEDMNNNGPTEYNTP